MVKNEAIVKMKYEIMPNILGVSSGTFQLIIAAILGALQIAMLNGYRKWA